MGTFKTFTEWMAEKPTAWLANKITKAVSNSLDDLPANQAVDAMQGKNPIAQQSLMVKSLKEPHADSFSHIGPVMGIPQKKKMRKK